MARYRKKKKREDYRSGGRVALRRGGPRSGIDEEERRIQEAVAPVDPGRPPERVPFGPGHPLYDPKPISEPVAPYDPPRPSGGGKPIPSIPKQPWISEPIKPGPIKDPAPPHTQPSGSRNKFGFIPPPKDQIVTQAFVDYHNPTTGQTFSTSTGGWTAPEGWVKGRLPEGWTPPSTTRPEDFEPGIDSNRKGLKGIAENVRNTIREEDILEQARLDAVHQYQQEPQYTDYDPNRFPGSYGVRGQYGNTAANNQSIGNTANQASQGDEDLKQKFEDERAERIIRSGRTAEQIASGDIPAGTLREADLAKVPITPESISDAVQMGEIPQVEGTKIQPVSAEQVAVMDDLNKAKTPEQLQAAKFTASKVLQSPDVQAAQGSLSDGALAQAVGVDRVPTIDSADVVVEEGAVTNRIVGTLSDGAKAQAAVTAGTTLGRLSRAKKQLRKAGMSESDIADLGNDPSLLEDKLTDFTEAERGVIEGLPQEALVSTQLNSLLEGVENGNIPPWASPAVSAVEQMLAARGLSASTVGKENLLNAIIQSAVPIAQANAQAIQQSVSQQRGIDAQVALKEAEFRQQTALSNADKVFNLDMAQFSTDAQVNLANSKFFQTVSLTEASMEQQGIMQDAALLSQANLAEADFNTRLGIQNAQAFLSMDMSNLDKRQQSNLLKAQQEQQRLLTNQAADNASKQFNAVSENQTNQFMTSMATQISQFNAQQANAASQFNAQQQNAAEARRAARDTELNKANAAIMNQVAQFNTQLDFNREQWNKQNEQAVRQSNVAWRRQANLADTAAQNAINQQNVQNAFGLTQSALSFAWQELRDQADYDFRWATDSANRKTQAMIAAASAEGDAAKTWSANFKNASGVIDNIFGTGG